MSLKQTSLHALHVELGGRMVPFGGYDMPVQFPTGIITEHTHTRTKAGLFDVSHMGQVILRGDNVAAELEKLLPGDIQSLQQGQMRYSFFTNDQGGILDDLMITQMSDHLYLVINAGCKDADVAHLRKHLPKTITLDYIQDKSLLALQGPKAAEILATHAPASSDLVFMTGGYMDVNGVTCFITRSGYTGEDGFEISVPNDQAETLARLLLSQTDVAPIGLGARDSLRLEAGLCLYGHDIDTTTTPVAASLLWAISKSRREAGGFMGADKVLAEIENKPAMKRVGILPDGKLPAREGAKILDMNDQEIGVVTSGGFGPTLGKPVAMGYVQRAMSDLGTQVQLVVRDKKIPGIIAKMPFVPQNYYRGEDQKGRKING